MLCDFVNYKDISSRTGRERDMNVRNNLGDINLGQIDIHELLLESSYC